MKKFINGLRIAVGIMTLVLVIVSGAEATRFISNDVTGGDCTSIGTWTDTTKTCTMTTDLGETIQIDSDGITLNGNGHTLTGSNIGNGVYLLSRTGVTIKNLNVKQFSTGIYLNSSSNNALIGNNASNNNGLGIYLYSSSNNTISGNNASNNYIGIYLDSSSNNRFYNNFFNNTYYIISGTNYWNTTKTSGENIVGGPYLGGNFWANPGGSGFSQTCTDSNGDGICDAQYTLESNNIDYLPLAKNTVGLPKTGDINGNGQLTLVDAIYLAKHVGGFSGYETIYADGDINANGKVTLVDAIYLAKHVGGFSGYETIYAGGE